MTDNESQSINFVINEERLEIKGSGGIFYLIILESIIENTEFIPIRYTTGLILEVPSIDICKNMDSYAYIKITPIKGPIIHLFNKIVKEGEHVGLEIKSDGMIMINKERTNKYYISKRVINSFIIRGV